MFNFKSIATAALIATTILCGADAVKPQAANAAELGCSKANGSVALADFDRGLSLVFHNSRRLTLQDHRTGEQWKGNWYFRGSDVVTQYKGSVDVFYGLRHRQCEFSY